MQKITVDKEKFKNTLENGLTYYVYPNREPTGYVTFSLAVRAGSAVETDDQCGIAHFIEHMCLLNYNKYYLQKQETGICITPEGYTNYDETVFKLSCLCSDENIENCVLIIKEILLGEAINKRLVENVRKGVINEWYITNRKVDFIKRKNIFPLILNESVYSDRFPIGNIESVMKFSYEDLMDFHTSWYRTELAAVIVCGDINSQKAEEIINKSFSDIQNHRRQNRIYQRIPDYISKRYIVNKYSDLEQPEVQIYYLQERFFKNIFIELNQKLIESMANCLIEKRILGVMKEAGLPLIEFLCTKDRFIRKYAFSVIAFKTKGCFLNVLGRSLEELLKINNEGFSSEEFILCKELFIQRIASEANNSNILKSEELAKECINDFLYDEPVIALDDEYNIYLELLNEIKELSIHDYIKTWLSGSNTAMVINFPENYLKTINNVEFIDCLNDFGFY